MIWMQQVKFRNIVYTNTHMYTIEIKEERGHEFEREWGKVYGRIWRKKREEKNLIKL